MCFMSADSRYALEATNDSCEVAFSTWKSSISIECNLPCDRNSMYKLEAGGVMKEARHTR
jgi:hypothetical protein